MIETFADKEAERLWSGQCSRKLPPDIQPRALAKLAILDLGHHCIFAIRIQAAPSTFAANAQITKGQDERSRSL
jgi:plasmid maintenance system killer protein